MEFSDDDLGHITAALASYIKILEDLDRAKANGYAPPCFNPKPGTEKGAEDLLARISRRDAN